MVNPNDPAAIPYVITEDDGVLWYVAYKEKNPGVPITVSAKGVANGLSTEYNDGYDFGPDTYNPGVSSGIPVTQTAGIQEAMNYAFSQYTLFTLGDHPFTYSAMPEIRFTEGQFNVNADIYLPLNDSLLLIPAFSLVGDGYGIQYVSTYIYLNGHNMYFGENGYSLFSTFKIQGINFQSRTTVDTSNQSNSLIFYGSSYQTPQFILRDVTFWGINLDMSNITDAAQINMDNIFLIYGAQLFLGQFYQLSATNLTCKNGLYINGVNQIGVVNMAEGVIIQSGNPSLSFNVWEIDNNGNAAYGIQNATASGTTSTLNIDIGTLIINNTENFFTTVSGSGTLNIKMHVKHLIFLTAVNNFTVSSGINLQEFTVDEITNLTTATGNAANLPILSTTPGTTAGDVLMGFTEYGTSYKKMIITFEVYENDTTTAQTIDFPLAFSTSALVSGNNTGLTISATTSGITITAPDSTTLYNGIVIVEGY